MFLSSKDEHKVSISPSAVNLEEAWNHHEGKNRFGQPIRKPALAEDVKGDCARVVKYQC